MLPLKDHFLPVGSISISLSNINLSPEYWSTEHAQEWTFLNLYSQEPPAQLGDHNHASPLEDEVERAILKAPGLYEVVRLHRAHWIALEFCVTSVTHGTLRVYMLPDDQLRAAVDRTNSNLWKDRRAALQLLNFSSEAWQGKPSRHKPGELVLRHPQGHQDEVSLLELFNSISDPDPTAGSTSESVYQEAMFNLLENNVPDLVTELWLYQRRSAAMMLQKEVAPAQVLDPRLLQLQGPDGSDYFHDPVLGSIVREPRYYDGVAGGILAEEMGSGKTVICLALILATKDLPTQPPEVYGVADPPSRPRIASLMDMAASCATRHAVPWKINLEVFTAQAGYELESCAKVLERNVGHYYLPPEKPRRRLRHPKIFEPPSQRIDLSPASIVVVPKNLLAQWVQEIQKHTQRLRVLVVLKDDVIPSTEQLLHCDIVLFSQDRFEYITRWEGGVGSTVLSRIHFKRCIVDEGHKLGNSRMGSRSNLLIGLDAMHVNSRWIVTGTPSKGLFGTDKFSGKVGRSGDKSLTSAMAPSSPDATIAEMERKDLERIGAITALYLKARPWANTDWDSEDTKAEWKIYLMLPRHHSKSHGRWDALKTTLNSLILRHRSSEIRPLLPPVSEKVVMLEGCYQDQLSLNIFSMMIIFNSVQSERTDMDYFFHPKQRRALLQIVHNLKQTSFFGGSFFTAEEIAKSVETAEKFLEEGKVKISSEDEELLRSAIQFGHIAMTNTLRQLSNTFHEMPVLIEEFPGQAGTSWSLDGKGGANVCTSASLLLALQKLVFNKAWQAEALNALLNGGLISEGLLEKDKILTASEPDCSVPNKKSDAATLAGNTKLGKDSPRKARSHGVSDLRPKRQGLEASIAGPLELTRLVSTVSAKLSYLLDQIEDHYRNEKIIVFYENENVAWYLATMLDVLQIPYLIYAKTLSTKRRDQYIHTYNNNARFRVLLMDLTQASEGLDMKAASRIYFINPVLNPQTEAQAVGRVRRISQQKPVSVETLVLRGSIDEVLLERKQHMTQAEHRQVKSILDVQPIYNWIKKATMVPLGHAGEDHQSQMAPLQKPQQVFGERFKRALRGSDQLLGDEAHLEDGEGGASSSDGTRGAPAKRARPGGPDEEADVPFTAGERVNGEDVGMARKRIRFAE